MVGYIGFSFLPVHAGEMKTTADTLCQSLVSPPRDQPGQVGVTGEDERKDWRGVEIEVLS